MFKGIADIPSLGIWVEGSIKEYKRTSLSRKIFVL